MKRLLPLKIIASTSLFVMLQIICGTSNTKLHPLILIPGAGGNQLEARLTDGYKPTSLLCNRWYPLHKDHDGWFRMWFDPSVLVPPFTRCFAHRMTLHFDPNLDDYFNAPGVQTRVPQFGSTRSLRHLDPYFQHVSAYMGPLVDSLEEVGYVEGETLFGAPYDFRYGLAAKGHLSRVGSEFLEDLKCLIEKASASNDGKQVILVSHSLGGLFAIQLLNRNPLSWRQKFIKHFVALSAPWGGAVDEVLTFASGNTLGIPLVDPLTVREEQRNSESNLWLLPNPRLFGGAKPLVITKDRNYTASDISDFLRDIGFAEGVYPYESRILPLIENTEAPEVPVTCIMGTGVRTPESLFYRNSDFDEQPEVFYGDGDGTVNMVSLLGLQSLWRDEKNQSLEVIKIGGVSHMAMLKDETALDVVIGVISKLNFDGTTFVAHKQNLVDAYRR